MPDPNSAAVRREVACRALLAFPPRGLVADVDAVDGSVLLAAGALRHSGVAVVRTRRQRDAVRRTTAQQLPGLGLDAVAVVVRDGRRVDELLRHCRGAVSFAFVLPARLHPAADTAGTDTEKVGRVVRLLRACTDLLADDGVVLVAAPSQPRAATAITDVAAELGLGYLQHVVALTAPVTGDTLDSSPGRRERLDLLVFTARAGA